MTIEPDDGPGLGFDSELSIQGMPGRPTQWLLTSPLIWNGTQGDRFVVPLGFTTDFASVPRVLHWLILPYGAYTRAAVLHDWLLTELAAWHRAVRDQAQGERAYLPQQPPADSRDCDGIFRRVMQDLGVPWAKRWVMWAAVRAAALFNPDRAYGRAFHKDAAKVIAVAVVAVPFLLPGVLGVAISLTITRVFTLSRKAVSLPD